LDKQFFKKEKKENWLINHIGLLILILAFIGGFTAFIVAKTYTSNFLGDFSQHQDKWGQFGDYFGGILNPTFSFLALIALLCTLYVQRYELKNARGEFNLSSEIQLLAQIIKYKNDSIKINLEQFEKFKELANKVPENPNFKKAADHYLQIYQIECYQKYFYEKRVEEVMESISGIKLTEQNRKKGELNLALEKIINEIKKG